MAPASQSTQQAYSKDERVLCFHHELLYEAKILDSKLSNPDDRKSQMLYRVHYKGWKNTWDDWVSGDRIRKLTDENRELAQNLKKEFDALRKPPPAKPAVTKKRPAGSDSARDSEERQSSAPAIGRRRGRDSEIEKEDSFYARPHIRIPCPDNLKSLLVDDWENVTKNLLLVKLPSKTPVNLILDTYFEEEKGKRRLGSSEADLLEEVVAGVKEYFDKCLGRILLYRFEREQFFELRKLWEGAVGGEWEGKGPGDVYGAEHLARLFVSMPELIAQTNMDNQAINRLREELAKITMWLGRNSAKYFNTEYEAPSQEYVDKARGI